MIISYAVISILINTYSLYRDIIWLNDDQQIGKAQIAFDIIGFETIAIPFTLTIFKRTECLFMSFSKIDDMARVSIFQKDQGQTNSMFEYNSDVDDPMVQNQKDMQFNLQPQRNSLKITGSNLFSFLNGNTSSNRQSLVQMNIESAKLRQLSIKSFTVSND